MFCSDRRYSTFTVHGHSIHGWSLISESLAPRKAHPDTLVDHTSISFRGRSSRAHETSNPNDLNDRGKQFSTDPQPLNLLPWVTLPGLNNAAWNWRDYPVPCTEYPREKEEGGTMLLFFCGKKVPQAWNNLAIRWLSHLPEDQSPQPPQDQVYESMNHSLGVAPSPFLTLTRAPCCNLFRPGYPAKCLCFQIPDRMLARAGPWGGSYFSVSSSIQHHTIQGNRVHTQVSLVI